MNTFFLNKLKTKITQAITDANELEALKHRGLEGTIREILIDNLIKPLLPMQFEIGTGKITDVQQKMSKQIDIVIYSRMIMSPLFFSEKRYLGIYPIDSVLATIEVKTKLTSTSLEEAIVNAESCNSDNYTHLSGKMTTEGKVEAHGFTGVFRTLFAFGSDLSGKSEFDRYKELDKLWNTRPKIQMFCVVGKGLWLFQTTGEARGWHKVDADHNRSEIVAFLRVLVDTVQKSLPERGSPNVGHYLIDNSKFVKVD